MKFMGIQPGMLGPVVKTPGGVAFMSEPEALAVVGQDPDGSPSPAAENKKRPIKGVLPENLTADPAEAIDPFAEINRLNTKKNPHLGNDLDHRPCLRKAPMSASA